MATNNEILIANLTLDTYRKNAIPPLVVPQGDYGARVIRVTITNQGTLVHVNDSDTVYIMAERRGDGRSEAFAGKVNSDGSVTVPVTQWMLDVPGNDVICNVVVTGDEYQYSTTDFIIEPQFKKTPYDISEDDPRYDFVTEAYNLFLDLDERVTALEANICFQEGTQILMADGTSKNIEDVEYGDMIMTWDIENQRTMPCKSFGRVYTGITPGWEHLCFDNGAILKIYQTHRIFNADKGFLVQSKEWLIGQKAIASDGTTTTYCYHPKKVPAAIASHKYTIFCETGMFFANGILCGHPISQPLDIYNRTHKRIPLSEEEIADMQAYADARDNYYVVEVQNLDYLRESLPFRKAQDIANRKIDKYKKNLSDRDYKTIKAMQGKLSDDEMAENIATCEDLRSKVNEQEAIVKENEDAITALQDRYGVHPKLLQEIESINVNKAVAKARAKYVNGGIDYEN
jgi:hypothetical protein